MQNFRAATIGFVLAIFAVCSSGCSTRTTTYTSPSGSGPTIQVINPEDCVWFQGPEVWGAWRYLGYSDFALTGTMQSAKLGAVEIFFVCGRVPPTNTPDTNNTDTDGGTPNTDENPPVTDGGTPGGDDTSDGCAPARVTHNGKCHEVRAEQCENNGKHLGWTVSEVPCQ